MAHWESAEGYERLRNSNAFKQTMARFADMFVGPPNISVNEILVQMAP